jgi:carboxylesterase
MITVDLQYRRVIELSAEFVGQHAHATEAPEDYRQLA